jgi:hypothetical protein
VVLGTEVEASFEGAFEISGNLSPGIGTIDTLRSDTSLPEQIVATAAGANGLITGAGRPSPSIQEISNEVLSNRDRALLLDPRFLWDFTHRAPKSRIFILMAIRTGLVICAYTGV